MLSLKTFKAMHIAELFFVYRIWQRYNWPVLLQPLQICPIYGYATKPF